MFYCRPTFLSPWFLHEIRFSIFLSLKLSFEITCFRLKNNFFAKSFLNFNDSWFFSCTSLLSHLTWKFLVEAYFSHLFDHFFYSGQPLTLNIFGIVFRVFEKSPFSSRFSEELIILTILTILSSFRSLVPFSPCLHSNTLSVIYDQVVLPVILCLHFLCLKSFSYSDLTVTFYNCFYARHRGSHSSL